MSWINVRNRRRRAKRNAWRQYENCRGRKWCHCSCYMAVDRMVDARIRRGGR